MPDELLSHLHRLHTTELGTVRIRRNVAPEDPDVVEWCRKIILHPCASISRKGKNWYISAEGCIITVNAHSFTIITAHREKNPAVSMQIS